MLNMAVIDQVAILFIIMAIGIIARKKKILTDEVKKGVTDLILNITLPFMIIASFNQKFSMDMLVNAGAILIFSTSIHTISYFISKILYFKSTDDRKSVLRYLTVFSNAAFMGYPVLEAMYGKIGVFYASIYCIPVRVFMWTLGVMLFTSKKEGNYLKQIFFNPGIIAVIIGSIPFSLSIQFPIIISNTLNMMGNMTTPLSMLMVGSMIADADIKKIFEGTVFYGAFVRLIMIPIVVLTVLKLIGIRGELLGVTVVLTAMPAASFTAILAGKFHANEVFASKCVFVSTLLSIVTIPLILLLI
ncbi:AEC family transporter [Clostridium sp. PL3]|uniref:AEC family transporter n=1 Tax=Clostridium thailandense TaxID=2794346 RepID=A0A949U5P7_9CLOT|nr:AEC family transporter [Clostridium thailandense]MBV7276944.1 AEC family transporter [Clostridium thailandense]